MALKIESIKESPTGKRVDAVVRKTSFWGSDERFEIRIISGKKMEDPEDLLKEIVEQREDWQQGKKNRYLKLYGINGTAYILKEETIES